MTPRAFLTSALVDELLDDPRVWASRERAHEQEAFYGFQDDIANARRDRNTNLGKARLCATTKGRQTWIDLAREASLRLVRAKRGLRVLNASLRFGPYQQRQIAPGVHVLEMAS